jgi:uncharacterized repeat protein (TIGR01451 family)
MKKTITRLLCVPFLVFGSLYAQFALSHSTNAGSPHLIKRDGFGNVYVAIDVNGGSLGGVNYPNGYNPGLGIAKFNDQGQFLWSSMSGPSPYSESIQAMDVDAHGNIVFAVEFHDTLRWGSWVVTAPPSGRAIGMIDSVGTIQWLYCLSNTGWVAGTEVIFLSNGNIGFATNVKGPAALNGYSFPASTVPMGYVCILNRAGTVLNAYQLNGLDQAAIAELAEAPNGDLFLTGKFKGSSASFLGATIPFQGNPASPCFFLASITQSGSLNWFLSFSDNNIAIADIDVDRFGNCYFVGTVTGAVTLGGMTVVANSGNGNVLAGKMDPHGSPVWIISTQNANSDEDILAMDCSVDNRVLLSGSLNSGSGTLGGIPYTASMFSSIVAVLDSNAIGIWCTVLDTGLMTNMSPRMIDSNAVFLAGSYYTFGTYPMLFGYPLSYQPTNAGAFWADVSIASNRLHGFHYADLDQNGTYGAGDALVVATPVTTGTGLVELTSQNGEFDLYVGPGGYSISSLAASPMFSVQPGQYNGSFVGIGNADTTLVFRSVPNQLLPDLTLSLLTPETAGTGTPYAFNILASNQGTVAASGILTLELDPHTLFQSSTPPPNAVNGNQLVWNMTAIPALGSQSISVLALVQNGVLLGDSLLHFGNLATNGADFDLYNQSDTTKVFVSAAFDPNDKLVTPTIGNLNFANSNRLLHYQIRFQNTGNDTAWTVILRDTLPIMLDPATFRFLGSSHPCTVTMPHHNELYFRFDSIALPDSATNAMASSGFVAFEMNLRPGLAIGDTVANRAGIYFDYNAVVLTKSAVFTVIEETNAVSPQLADENIRLFPNPGTGGFHIEGLKRETFPVDVSVYDLTGKIVLKRTLDQESANSLISLSGQTTGVFHVRVVTSSGDVFLARWVNL